MINNRHFYHLNTATLCFSSPNFFISPMTVFMLCVSTRKSCPLDQIDMNAPFSRSPIFHHNSLYHLKVTKESALLLFAEPLLSQSNSRALFRALVGSGPTSCLRYLFSKGRMVQSHVLCQKHVRECQEAIDIREDCVHMISRSGFKQQKTSFINNLRLRTWQIPPCPLFRHLLNLCTHPIPFVFTESYC